MRNFLTDSRMHHRRGAGSVGRPLEGISGKRGDVEGLGVEWSAGRPRRKWQIAQHRRHFLVLVKEGMRAEVGEGREA